MKCSFSCIIFGTNIIVSRSSEKYQLLITSSKCDTFWTDKCMTDFNALKTLYCVWRQPEVCQNNSTCFWEMLKRTKNKNVEGFFSNFTFILIFSDVIYNEITVPQHTTGDRREG